MTAPDRAAAALGEFRATLREIIDLLVEHRQYQWVSGLQNLGARAEEDPTRSPDEVLADLGRAYSRFITIPDGFSAEYIRDGIDVDDTASDRLDALRDRLIRALHAGQAAS